MGGLLPTFIDPAAATSQLTSLATNLDSTNNAVLSCTALSSTQAQAWNSFYMTASQWAKTTTPGWITPSSDAVYEQARVYARTLYAWQQQLQKAGCNLGIPVVDPDANPQVDQFLNALKYTAFVVGGLTGAYVLYSILQLIPPPPREAPEKKE